MDLLPKKKTAAPKIVSGGVPRVNLLPREVIAKREQSGMIKSWGVRVAAAVVVVAAGAFGMFGWQAITALRLAATQAEGMSLLSQIGAKAEIQQLVQTESNLGAFEMNALATDLSWTESVQKILAKFPEGAWLCRFELASGAAPSGDAEAQVGLSGVFSICGSFPSAIPYLRDATSVDGVLSAVVLDGKYETDISAYVHQIAIEFDQTIYLGDKKNKDSAGAESEPSTDETSAAGESMPVAPETSEGSEDQPVPTTPATEEAAA